MSLTLVELCSSAGATSKWFAQFDPYKKELASFEMSNPYTCRVT